MRMGRDKEMDVPVARTGYAAITKESGDEELMMTTGFWLGQLRGVAVTN